MQIRRVPWDNKALQPVNHMTGDATDPKNSMTLFRQEIMPIIKPYFSKYHRLLDVGCGNGRIAAELSKSFRGVCAIDVEDYFSFYRDNMFFMQTSFEDYELPYRYMEFGTILFFGSFYTFGNTGYRKTIEKCLSLLTPGGNIIIIDDKKRLTCKNAENQGFYTGYDLGIGIKDIELKVNEVQKNGVHRILVLEKK